MAKLQIFIDKTPIYTNTVIKLRAGFFADDYSLTDVTAECNFKISFGNKNITQIDNNSFLTNTAGDFGIQAIYAISGDSPEGSFTKHIGTETIEYIATTSFVIINQDTLPDKDDIYICIKREEPQNVYTQIADPDSFTYLDNQAVSDIFATLYKNLQIEANQIYPELTNNYTDWLNMLTYEVYINTEQGQINRVLQLLRNLQIQVSMNPFDIAKSITSYIYYRTNLAIYVFIQEDKVNFDEAWILGTGQSILGVNTYLSSGKINTDLIINVFDTMMQLDDLFRVELDSFISKITRAYFGYTVDYSKTPEYFNLNYDIGMTYKGDMRIIYSYCLKYDELAFYKVTGLINPIQPNYIQEMVVTPSNGAVIDIPTKLIVTGVFIDGVTADIILYCEIIKDNNNLYLISDVLVPNKVGRCSLTITYGDITQTVTYISKPKMHKRYK